MTNKGILKRKERRKLKREWKMKVLQFAKEFYNTPIQKENPCEQAQRYFKGNQNFELYLNLL